MRLALFYGWSGTRSAPYEGGDNASNGDALSYASQKASPLFSPRRSAPEREIHAGDLCSHSARRGFANDEHADEQFDYMLANPPYGGEWKPDEAVIRKEHERGEIGRFAPGLPRISDGQLHLLDAHDFQDEASDG